jgi:hypothetical protein
MGAGDMDDGEWHRIPTAAQLRNRIIFPTPQAVALFVSPSLPSCFALASHHPNYSTRSLLRLPVSNSLVFAIVLFPFPCSESLSLSQLIFVAVVVYRFFHSRVFASLILHFSQSCRIICPLSSQAFRISYKIVTKTPNCPCSRCSPLHRFALFAIRCKSHL